MLLPGDGASHSSHRDVEEGSGLGVGEGGRGGEVENEDHSQGDSGGSSLGGCGQPHPLQPSSCAGDACRGVSERC